VRHPQLGDRIVHPGSAAAFSKQSVNLGPYDRLCEIVNTGGAMSSVGTSSLVLEECGAWPDANELDQCRMGLNQG
jgi:hypothetical protein